MKAKALCQQQTSNHRDGFTLIEVCLVIGLIVLIAGMALPQLFGTLHLQRLRSAADELRTDLSKARNRAMSSGQTLGLTLTENSYTIGLAGEIDENEASAPAFQQRTVRLVEGLRLISLAGQGGLATPPDQSAGNASMPTVGSDGIAAYFYPDGTTSTVEFQLFNDKENTLVVSLRGITGVALVQAAPSQSQGLIVAEFPAAKGGTTP